MAPSKGTRSKHSAGFWRDWGLTITLLTVFAIVMVGQVWSGWDVYNADQREHGSQPVSLTRYLGTAHFWEATTENWESEFLQMFSFVVLTVFLRQRGSPESDPPKEPPGRERAPKDPDPAWPLRRGGVWRRLYEHSLSLALLILFVASFSLHVLSGADEFNQQQRSHGEPAVAVASYLTEPRMWFESFQNWQSEFLSTGLLVILSVYLREKGSSQSKPVEESMDSTGEE